MAPVDPTTLPPTSVCGLCGHKAIEHLHADQGGCYHIHSRSTPVFDCDCGEFEIPIT